LQRRKQIEAVFHEEHGRGFSLVQSLRQKDAMEDFRRSPNALYGMLCQIRSAARGKETRATARTERIQILSKVSAPKVPESGVLKACLDLLAAEKIWHRRWNTGAVKAGKRFFRFGEPGDADILALLPKEKTTFHTHSPVLFIECKSDSGRQTKEQWLFEAEVKGQGHEYLLVRDVDTLRDWLKEKGI
jgi:hypothetical protein